MKFSALNEHRFRHNIDCNSPACMCGRGIEDNKHFLLHCHQFDLTRKQIGRVNKLFHQLTIPGLDINDALCSLILFGSKDLNLIENIIIIEATKLSRGKSGNLSQAIIYNAQ